MKVVDAVTAAVLISASGDLPKAQPAEFIREGLGSLPTCSPFRTSGAEKIRQDATTATLEERFGALLAEWKSRQETRSSVSTASTEHDAYQKIIRLGRRAIPLILKELQREPDHWFVALRALSGENPVPASARGRIREMAEVWIAWGKSKEYIS